MKTNQTETAILSHYAGCCRFVWNKALSLQKARLTGGERCLSYTKLAALLPEWKEEAPSQSLQQTLMSLGKAIHDSFRTPQGFEINGQAQAGWTGYRNSRKIEGSPKNVTISKVAGSLNVCVQVEIHQDYPVHESAAIDVGIALFAALSDGSWVDPANSLRKSKEKARLQQQARKKKFSKNWRKVKARIQKQYHH